MDSAGRVRADSDFPPGPLPAIESHLDRPEIRAALTGRIGVATRRGEVVDRELLYVAVPGGPGAIRLAADLRQVDEIVRRAQAAVAGAAVFALLVGGVLAMVAGRSIARPLTQITTAARAIAAGSPPRFPRSGVPDIDALVQALRQMHRQLADRFEELRREQAETAALVESMVEGVVAADERGRIATANPAARRLLGYDPLDALPDLAELFRVKAAREVVDAVLQGTPVQDREVDLAGRSVLLNARPLPAGGAVLVMHDLTELRKLEAVRRDFVANVSHELKTPLTSISGYAETLLSLPPDPDMARVFLGTILGNARRMQRLVDDLLDLSRIESGRWQPARTEIDVASAARESWTEVAARPDVAADAVQRAGGTRRREDLRRSRRGAAGTHQPAGELAAAYAVGRDDHMHCAARRATGSRSRCGTTDPGSPASTCRGSSSGSIGRTTRRGPARRAAPGSASPSSSTWSRRTGGGSGRRVSGARAPRSPAGFRTPDQRLTTASSRSADPAGGEPATTSR